MTEETQTAGPLSPALPEGDFAVIEIMGHRTRWGRVEEVERFGAKFLRVHSLDEAGQTRVEDYAGAALFSVTQVPRVAVEAHDERNARRRQQEEEWRRAARSRMLPLDGRGDEDVRGDEDGPNPADLCDEEGRITITEEGPGAQLSEGDAP